MKKVKTSNLTLNDSTIKSLKQYLNQLPDDTKLMFSDVDYKNYILQIGCNFEWQEENKTVLLIKGFRITD